jgi:hypothetical protein
MIRGNKSDPPQDYAQAFAWAMVLIIMYQRFSSKMAAD